MRTSTPPGCGRWPRPTARRCAASARSCATWRTTPSTASPARRRSSTRGSRSAIPSSGGGCARRSSAGSSCRSAAAGSSPTATCRPASRSCASSCYGQRWFEREFGRRHREFWSPDAFGYAGQLPQILREAGITRFLTQKLSWNRFNRPEHHTLTWQGDDGSEVLAHYPPADTYNSDVSVPELLKAAREYLRSRPLRARACSCSASATAAAARPGPCSRRCGARPTCRACRARRSARARSSSTRSRPGGGDRPVVTRRAVLRVPPRRLHLAGAHEARQPARRAGAARRRVPRLPGRRVPARRARPALEAAPAAAVPRHPAGLVDRSRLRGRRARSRRRRGRRATRSTGRGRRSSTRSGSRGARSWATRSTRPRPTARRASSSPATRCASTG